MPLLFLVGFIYIVSVAMSSRIELSQTFVASRAPITSPRHASKVSLAAAKKAWVGPQKGSWVRILRPDSFWFQESGEVVNVNQSPAIKCPVSVKFDVLNYGHVNVNAYAFWEVEELDDFQEY